MSDEVEPVISIRGLVNRFGDQTVHEGLDLDVRAGEILGVVGGSGTGKSVLMRSIIGLQQPEAGSISVFGVQMLDRDEEEDEQVSIRRRWGVLFQGGALFSTLTVSENVQVPIREYYPEMTPELRMQIAGYKILLTGLPADAAPKYPSELSGGMRKRAGLARALALDPAFALSRRAHGRARPDRCGRLRRAYPHLQQILGLTIFLITHDLDTLHAICDRVAVIADKHVIAVGTIPELLALDHPWIQEYFNGPRGRIAAAGDAAVQKRVTA